MINQIKDIVILFIRGIDTSFEQYKDIFVNLGLSASFDDLQTESTASSSLKKQSGNFTEFAAVWF